MRLVLLKCSFSTVFLLNGVRDFLSGVAISQTRVIKIFGGISLVKDHSFLVAKGKQCTR